MAAALETARLAASQGRGTDWGGGYCEATRSLPEAHNETVARRNPHISGVSRHRAGARGVRDRPGLTDCTLYVTIEHARNARRDRGGESEDAGVWGVR